MIQSYSLSVNKKPGSQQPHGCHLVATSIGEAVLMWIDQRGGTQSCNFDDSVLITESFHICWDSINIEN